MQGKGKQDYILLQVKVSPNARRNEVTGFTDGVMQVKIAAPPVEGKANEKLVKFLSDVLETSKSSITILKGLTSRNKVLSISGLSQEYISSKIGENSPSK
jgi:uncharacterized protein (TIGR00251 family)